MIRVTVELLRHGRAGDKELLGIAEIANVSGTLTRGDYAVRLLGKGGRAWKTGTVEGFPRKRLGGFDLLFRALGGLLAERNPKVPFPKAWEETSIDPGPALADAEEREPQVDGSEDPRTKALIEVLERWAKTDAAARKRIVECLRTGARGWPASGSSAIAIDNAANALEMIGEYGVNT